MSGPLALDLRAIQSPDHRGRGVGRYAYELAVALERCRPDLVGCYLLAPDWPPPGDIEPLLATGKVVYLTDASVLPDSIRVFHSMSPFELGVGTEAVWPALVEQRGLRFSATVYDLIPLRHRDTYLADAGQRRRYAARAEILRHADALLAISPSAERDVVELLGVPPDHLTTIGTGVSPRLAPPASRFEVFEAARSAVPGLVDPFVLYPGGSDGRKNVEALIRAFARLPESLRDGHQLVVPCDLPPLAANHFRHVAATEGIADRLVLPGFVPDRVLELLYQSTSLLCFPSLAEGFGLPVAEAIACGAIVVASDIAPLHELVVEEARFDPNDVGSISAAIVRGLSDPGFRARATGASALLDSWDDVAERAGKVFESLAAGRPRPWKRPPRLAFVSPFPPIASGVAAYSSKLVEALSAEVDGVEVDCFADGRDRDGSEPEVGRPWWDARSFGVVEKATGGYDDVVYVLGNSEYHAGALAALRVRPGLVMTHEVRLSNLLRYSTEVRGAVPGGVAAVIERTYGGLLPESLGLGDRISPDDQERYGLLMLRDILECTDRLAVTSEAARRLASIDAGPNLEGRLSVVPFALAMTPEELDAVSVERARLRDAGPRGGGGLVASFGIVDPSKEPFVLIDAVAELGRPGSSGAGRAVGAAADMAAPALAFVGPVSDELRLALAAHGEHSGVEVSITGQVSRPEYLAWLGRADIAVQLRTTFNGEASAAVGDCLATGLATVVSQIGWLSELSDDIVVKLARGAGSVELSAQLSSLLGAPLRSRELGAAAAAYAASCTFEAAAAALTRQLRLPVPVPVPVPSGAEG